MSRSETEPMAVPDFELVATGNELLNGRSVNTHARVLAEHLGELGWRLTRETTVRDDEAAIRAAVADAMRRVSVVFVTGGLGPTCDDLTREAVAGLLGRRLVEDAETARSLAERYARLGREFTNSRRRQALILEGAVVLPNRVGAAPGQRIETERSILFLLPGPPAELNAILQDHVLPWLRDRFPNVRPPPQQVFELCGIAESDAVERLREAGFDPHPLELAYCASPGQLEIRLLGRVGEENVVTAKAEEIRRVLRHYIFAETRRDLADVVAETAIAAEARVAVAESCTGGGLGHRLTSIPGSSAFFLGGIIAYANEVKTRELGVPRELLEREGAVSAAVARAMAKGVRERFRATHGVAITGIAGPTGATPSKPLGLVFIACAAPALEVVERHQFAGDRGLIRAWAVQYALDLLRRSLVPADAGKHQ